MTKKKLPFKRIETGYHNSAVRILAEWVNGKTEVPFYLDGKILFVPDVATYDNGIVSRVYEVSFTHPLNGKKLGIIQYWCEITKTPLTVLEISADYILAQTERPDPILGMECHIIDPFEKNYVMTEDINEF